MADTVVYKGPQTITGDQTVDGALSATNLDGILGANTPAAATVVALTATGIVKAAGANAQGMNLKNLTTGSGAMSSGATITLSNAIPAGCILMGVTARVTTTITGPTSWLLGVIGDTNQWGDTLVLTAGTTVDLTDLVGTSPPEFFAAATDILITRGSASDFTAGVVSVTVHYIDMTAATS